MNEFRRLQKDASSTGIHTNSLDSKQICVPAPSWLYHKIKNEWTICGFVFSKGRENKFIVAKVIDVYKTLENMIYL